MPFLDLEEELEALQAGSVINAEMSHAGVAKLGDGFSVVWGPDKQLEYYHHVLKHDPIYRFKRSAYFKRWAAENKEKRVADRRAQYLRDKAAGKTVFNGRTREQKDRVNELRRLARAKRSQETSCNAGSRADSGRSFVGQSERKLGK